MTQDWIFVTDRLGEQARKALSGFEILEQTADEPALSLCKAALVWPSRFVASMVKTMKNLRAVQTMSAGVDGLDFRSIPEDVAVFSNAGAFTEPVAEHAWGLALGAAKGLLARKAESTPVMLRDGTILVLGCGAIGSEVARMAKSALSMRTVGVSRSFKVPDLFDERHPLSDLQKVIGEADLVVDALPLTLETRGVLGHDALKLLKETGIIVNVGRAETVDQEAMEKLLRERPNSRYVTDVFWPEGGREAFDTPLWELQNFGGTFHNAGGGSTRWVAKAQAVAAENLQSFLLTGRANNRVSRSDYFA